MKGRRTVNAIETRQHNMTNETINRRVEKIRDEMTYLIEDLEVEKGELEEEIIYLEERNSQAKRLDALNERRDMLEQLIDALNIDLEEYYL